MIKSNELREGNLLLSVLTKEYVRVGWLQIKHVSDGNIQSAYDTTPVYEPIPLSAEILGKIGKTEKDGWVYLPKDYRVCCAEVTGLCNFSIGMTEFGNDEIDWFVIALPEHLHQLQNLYFALTGQDLEIEL